jgi:transposase
MSASTSTRRPTASHSISAERGLLTTWIQERLHPIQAAVVQVVYEARPTGFGLARRLRAEGYRAQVIAPSKLLAPVGPEAKSDRFAGPG